MKLLLVAIHLEPSARAVPLGAAMLAAVLKRSLADVLFTDVLNLYLQQSVAECAEAILLREPDAVGFSMYMWNRDLTLEVARCLRERDPDLVLFAGGPEVTMALGEGGQGELLDFVLPGECEETIVPAMRYLLDGGNPKALADCVKPVPVSDLSALPSPYLDRTLELGDYDGVLWELSRGCPFSCDFCYESRGAAGIRRFPMDRVLDELRLFDAAGVEQVFVLDPTFNYDKAMAKRILKHIQELAPEIYFCFEVRSESIDAELAECFGAVNCTLQIGLQSASDAVLRNVNRSLDRPDFEQKVFLLHQAGVVYGFDLIYGLPGDSYEGFCESLDYAMGFIPNHVDLFPLAVLPGTRLQETAASLGVTHQLSAPYHVTDVRGFPEEDLIEASELSAAFDLFYNKGQAVPWFDIVVRALDMAPSAFFDELATWLLTAKAFADVVELQSCFVAEMLVQAGKAAFVELASDLVTYFGSFEALVDTETSVCFHHDPVVMLDLLCSGIADLEELSAMLPKRACLASVSLQDGEPSILIRDREDAMDLRPL